MKRVIVALIAAGLIIPGFVLAQDAPKKEEKAKKKSPKKSKKKVEAPKKEG